MKVITQLNCSCCVGCVWWVLAQLRAIREDFHRHPELSYEEFRTAAACAKLLRGYGYDVRTAVAKTGVVADLGQSGPLVVVRADMDALPTQTILQTPYASCEPGKMHACGHDAHMAMALGAARLLSETKTTSGLPGRLRFLFQPAEESADSEGKTGARRMVEDGLLTGAHAVIGQHGMPDIPVGKVAILEGPVMAASTPFEIIIKGQGGHIAEPERTIDTILIAGHIRVKAKNLLTRRGMDGGALIGFGCCEGDTRAFNVVPQRVLLRGSIRTFSDKTQRECQRLLEQLCKRACRAHGGTFDLNFGGTTPVTDNDAEVARVMRNAARKILGQDSAVETRPRFTAEDFAWYKYAAPSAFMLIGTGTTAHPTQLHAANYDTPNDVLAIGAAILAETAVRLLGSGSDAVP